MGSFVFHHLDENTRACMIADLEADLASGTLYCSRDFSASGNSGYAEVVRTVLASGDEDSLKEALTPEFFNETRSDKNGRVTKLNRDDSARKFADGEFLRFYLRGLCLRAETDGVIELEVYRAKQSVNPRRESEEKIGTTVVASELLADLRQNKGLDTHLGLPPGPHSGLAARYKMKHAVQ